MDTEDFTYNEEELELLRKYTHLGIISRLRIYKKKKDYDNFYKLYKPYEESNCYPKVYELLEYDLRVKKWIGLCTRAWEKYIEIEQDGYGLDEFSKKSLNYCRARTKGK